MTNAKPKYAGKFSRKDLPPAISYCESQNIKLIGHGEWRHSFCPFHPDTKPNLRINIKRGAYRCMVCGARGGDVLSFHMHRYGLCFVDACKQLGVWVSI